METYYSKKEYDTMVKSYEKKVRALIHKISKLENTVKELKEDYNILLETATESRN